MIRRPPRSTLDRSSAASDVYKRQEWERYVSRQARWVDFVDDYKTMDLPYMESVMWALSLIHISEPRDRTRSRMPSSA